MCIRFHLICSACILILVNGQTHLQYRKFLQRGLEPLSQQAVSFINSINTTWRAGSLLPLTTDLKKLTGRLKDPLSRKAVVKRVNIPTNIPPYFDARETWPNCPTIREIRDQSNCGSCWAFATVETISDRICIASNQRLTVQISAQELITCCTDCGHGCHGGYPTVAWEYYVNEGLVTGGLYNGTGCQPYSLPPHHHGENYTETPNCERTCVNGQDFTKDKHYGLYSYSLTGVTQIQAEIMQHGPVTADFTVFTDFPSYKEGIYQRHSHDAVGGHDVKIIGWGEEAGIPYWIIANSWNTEWGEGGFFRIVRGSNECGIEGDVVAGIPDVG